MQPKDHAKSKSISKSFRLLARAIKRGTKREFRVVEHESDVIPDAATANLLPDIHKIVSIHLKP
jgi:hypothetical protein